MRTENSIKNVFTVIIPYFIIGVLGFIKAKAFEVNLEQDIYSLNQLFFQIIGYFSLAEAGFEYFIAQKYFVAFSADDKSRIKSIFSTSLIYFRALGGVMLLAGFVVMFFVKFLTKAEVDDTYLKIIFFLFVAKNTVDYFMMSPRIVLSADQKAYKINLLINLVRILENICDIALAMLGVDYIVILLPGIAIRIVINLIINHISYKEYPWLPRKKHRFTGSHLSGMSNLIYQRLAGILNSNTDIILVSAFVSPASVIIYTSYNYITKFVNDTIAVMANALTPSFANAANEGDRDKSYSIFSEMNDAFFFIAAFFSVALYMLLDPFVYMWMGEKYLITRIGLLLMIYIMFDGVCKRMINLVINSLGLYRETKIPTIVEAVINFAVSIILVQKIGLAGVLIGTVVSSLVTTWWFNPKYIYNKIFGRSFLLYLRDYIIAIVSAGALIFLLPYIPMFDLRTPLHWILAGILYSVITAVVLFVVFWFCTDSFKKIVSRLIWQIKSKLGKAK